MTTKLQIDKKIDNLQGQIDMIQRGDSVFKGYVQKQLRLIVRTMATKDDLYHMESRLRVDMATKDDLREMETRLRGEMATKSDLQTMATKDDLNRLTTLVVKIAEKVGVSM